MRERSPFSSPRALLLLPTTIEKAKGGATVLGHRVIKDADTFVGRPVPAPPPDFSEARSLKRYWPWYAVHGIYGI